MYFRIGTIDGVEHVSDKLDEDEMRAALDAEDGYIGTGNWSDKQFTFDEYLDMLNDMMDGKDIDGMDGDTATVTIMVWDRERTIKCKYIVWHEIVGRKTT